MTAWTRWCAMSNARAATASLGINIGKNKDTPNETAADDYLHCLERVYALADYVTVNISSPNTSGLRDLQEEETLRRFVGDAARAPRKNWPASTAQRMPMLFKIAPDLTDLETRRRRLGVQRRARGRHHHHQHHGRSRSTSKAIRWQREVGGLSGAPLVRQVHRGAAQAAPAPGRAAFPLVGVGGILSGADAVGKITAGAHARAVLHRHGLSRPGTDRRMRRPRSAAAKRASPDTGMHWLPTRRQRLPARPQHLPRAAPAPR